MNYITAAGRLSFNERITFLKKFMELPSQVGSLTPSSRFLAGKMLAGIDWENVRALAELGAGTGAFTKFIYKLKHPGCTVAVFEKDRAMRCDLAKRYPGLSYFDDAACLQQKIKSIKLEPLDAVISGLPFMLMKASMREHIVDEVIKSLKPNGTFVAFQYSLQMKTLLVKRFSRVKISCVPLNFLPAFVYFCS